MWYLLAFAMSFVITIGLIPLLTRLAKKVGFVDKPTERKQHKYAAPLIGGLAMFLGFIPSFAIFVGFSSFEHVAILIGAMVILSIGLLDDYYKTRGREFPVFPRLLAHVGVAALVYAAGLRFWGFTIPFVELRVDFPGILPFVFTVMWVFGVISAMNFSDGLDGLAGGFSGITAVTLFIFAMFMGEISPAFMAVALIGCILAFMRYNFFPAKIFMGDSGANFLGFILAVVALYGFKQATVISIFIPVLALGVPIFDSLAVVIKRFVTRKPIYKADNSHIHQRLLKKGLNPVQTVIFLFLICICLNLTSIILMLL